MPGTRPETNFGVATTSIIVITIAPIRTHAVPWCFQVLKVLELGLGTTITCTLDPRVSGNGDWDVENAKFLTVPIIGQRLASNVYQLLVTGYHSCSTPAASSRNIGKVWSTVSRVHFLHVTSVVNLLRVIRRP